MTTTLVGTPDMGNRDDWELWEMEMHEINGTIIDVWIESSGVAARICTWAGGEEYFVDVPLSADWISGLIEAQHKFEDMTG